MLDQAPWLPVLAELGPRDERRARAGGQWSAFVTPLAQLGTHIWFIPVYPDRGAGLPPHQGRVRFAGGDYALVYLPAVAQWQPGSINPWEWASGAFQFREFRTRAYYDEEIQRLPE